MQLAADQALRKELLLFAITKQPDLKAAMEMAAKMERFVLEGRIAPPQEAVPSGVSAGDATSADQPAPSSAPAPAVPGPYGSGGTKRRWSEADDAALKELWHSAVPLEEIAESMDRILQAHATVEGRPAAGAAGRESGRSRQWAATCWCHHRRRRRRAGAVLRSGSRRQGRRDQ